MTQKHYILIAAAFKTQFQSIWTEEAGRQALLRIAGEIANIAEDDNPRFDRARFLKACGIEN